MVADGSYRTVKGNHVRTPLPLPLARTPTCVLVANTFSQPLAMHPSSICFNSAPQWVIYHEIIITTKEYMRDVTVIEPHVYSPLPQHPLNPIPLFIVACRGSSPLLRLERQATPYAGRRRKEATRGQGKRRTQQAQQNDTLCHEVHQLNTDTCSLSYFTSRAKKKVVMEVPKKPLVGVSLMPHPVYYKAIHPLMSSGEIEAIEWR